MSKQRRSRACKEKKKEKKEKPPVEEASAVEATPPAPVDAPAPPRVDPPVDARICAPPCPSECAHPPVRLEQRAYGWDGCRNTPASDKPVGFFRKAWNRIVLWIYGMGL